MHLNPRAPVLARPGTAVQVGLTAPVVLQGLGRDERTFVASLEGGRPVSPLEARRFPRVVTRLTNAGAWWAPPHPGLAPSVAVHGCGRLGMTVAAALADAGLDVSLHDDAASGVEEAGLYSVAAAGATCAGAAVATLSSHGVRVRGGGGGDSLAAVICLGAPDGVLMAHLMAAGTPHVLVACTEAEVFVSHMVVPGVSACARCRDLTLTRADPAWPVLSLQLAYVGHTSRRPVASNAARPVVAGAVAAAVGRWVSRGECGSAVVVGMDGGADRVPFTAEPACGCGAAGSVGDEVAARRALLSD